MPDSSAYPIAAGVPDSGHRDHQVGLDGVLAGQGLAHLDPYRVQPSAAMMVSGRAR